MIYRLSRQPLDARVIGCCTREYQLTECTRYSDRAVEFSVRRVNGTREQRWIVNNELQFFFARDLHHKKEQVILERELLFRTVSDHYHKEEFGIDKTDYTTMVAQVERTIINEALALEPNLSRVAKVLHVGRSSLQYILERNKVAVPKNGTFKIPVVIGPLVDMVDQAERYLLERAMTRAGWHQTRAAESLRLPRTTLQYYLDAKKITPPTAKDPIPTEDPLPAPDAPSSPLQIEPQ